MPEYLAASPQTIEKTDDLPNLARLVHNNFDRIRNQLIASLGIIIADLSLPQHMHAMETGASAADRAWSAIPSAFEPPRVADTLTNKPLPGLDAAFDIAMISGSMTLAQRTTKAKGMVATAALAQAAATASDYLVAHEGLASRDELSEIDAGSSAVMTAFIVKYLYDRLAKAENTQEKMVLRLIIGAFVGAVTVGAAYIDRSHAASDFASHLSGAAVGYGASKMSDYSKAAIPGTRQSRRRLSIPFLHRKPPPESL